MRRTVCYGKNSNPEDFEWPKPSDLRNMTKKTLIKLAKLNYKPYSGGNRFGAFQVVLSNGESSPVFLSKD